MSSQIRLSSVTLVQNPTYRVERFGNILHRLKGLGQFVLKFGKKLEGVVGDRAI